MNTSDLACVILVWGVSGLRPWLRTEGGEAGGSGGRGRRNGVVGERKVVEVGKMEVRKEKQVRGEKKGVCDGGGCGGERGGVILFLLLRLSPQTLQNKTTTTIVLTRSIPFLQSTLIISSKVTLPFFQGSTLASSSY